MRISFWATLLGSVFVFNAHITQKNLNVSTEKQNLIKKEVEEKKEPEEVDNLILQTKYASISNLPISKHVKHIEKRCNARGWGEQCVRDTVALAKQESLGGKVMVGDNGKSHGWYHIQINLHKITKEQANDIIFATDWVHDRWQRLGYPLYRSKAIASHNCPACGYSGVGKKYSRSVKLKSEKLKNEKLKNVQSFASVD